MYLRPFTDADFNAIYALDVACFAPRFRFSRPMMRRVVRAPNAAILLACEASQAADETILGFCAVDLQIESVTPVAYVATLDVAPDRQGEGIGYALMEGMQEQVHKAGVRWMALHVYVGNIAALRLYERLGFRRGPRVPAFYGAGFDAWMYSKPLD